MNPTDLALEAAATITSSGQGNTGLVVDLTPAQARRVASDITATMQAIYTIAPAIYKRSIGADFGAPVTASLTATNGSDVVTTAQAFGDGCSVYVGGVMNEIRTEGAVKRLRFPFVGTSGAQTAVFYDDCKVLDSGVAKVLGPVSLAGSRCPLTKLDNRAQAEEWRRRRTGTPDRYWVEPYLLASSTPVYPDSITVTGAAIESGPDASGVYSRLLNMSSEFHLPTYGRLGADGAETAIDWQLRFDPNIPDSGMWSIEAVGGDPFANGYFTSATMLGHYAAVPGEGQGASPGADVTSNGGGITDAGNQKSTLRLRILPIPTAQTTIGYDIALRAPKFTVADLGTDAVPSTKTLVVAEDYHELLVRPIFLQFWAGSVWFPDDASLRKRIAQDDQAARAFLREYRPQHEVNRRITAI